MCFLFFFLSCLCFGMFLVLVVISLNQLEDTRTNEKHPFHVSMTNPKIVSICLSRKYLPSVSALQFFCVLNGYIIYFNLNHQVWITKHSPSWGKFGGSDKTHQQNTSVTMPAAGEFFLRSPSQFTANSPPQGLPVCSFEKPLPASYGRGVIRENPGYRDFKRFLLQSLVTFW